jgi:prephenate dehydratase
VTDEVHSSQSIHLVRKCCTRSSSKFVTTGIQGGAGSFNEEAARYYLSRTPEVEFELKYLHTTENVLRAPYEGDVDRGQFAIHNSIGGVVGESIQAMANYRFNIAEEYAIKYFILS